MSTTCFSAREACASAKAGRDGNARGGMGGAGKGEEMAAKDQDIEEKLARAGIDPGVTRAALEIDAILQGWRRRFLKRELGQQALRVLEIDIEQPQLDVLVATWAPVMEFGAEPGQETMVSTIAARLGIDPSRASRLVSDLIARGYLLRAVSQKDARRTVVELTDKGRAVIEAVRSFKFLVMGEFLSDWTEEEIAAFLPLLDRFSRWSDEARNAHSERVDDEIAALKKKLARHEG